MWCKSRHKLRCAAFVSRRYIRSCRRHKLLQWCIGSLSGLLTRFRSFGSFHFVQISWFWRLLIVLWAPEGFQIHKFWDKTKHTKRRSRQLLNLYPLKVVHLNELKTTEAPECCTKKKEASYATLHQRMPQAWAYASSRPKCSVSGVWRRDLQHILMSRIMITRFLKIPQVFLIQPSIP